MWIYQFKETRPTGDVSLVLPMVKVGAATVATATQVHLSLTPGPAAYLTSMTVAAVVVVDKVVTMEVIAVDTMTPHLALSCGQPMRANSVLLLSLTKKGWTLLASPAPLAVFLE